MSEKAIVYIITGPTASGKSSLALELAKRIDGEIIAADSMQVYKGLDIGTAKATVAEQSAVRHHLLDIREPWERYTVAEWLEDARAAIADILSRSKQPIICGGTGLYIKALVEGLDFAASENGSEIRSKLEARLEAEGAEAMHQTLRELDPEAAEKIHPNNTRRVIRALEIIEESGQSVAAYHKATASAESEYDYRVYLPSHPRERLYERCNKRVDQMLNMGILDEVRQILELDLPSDATCLQAIGYKEFFDYIHGAASLESCTALLKMYTRRYAKRQLTFFRPVDWLQYLAVDAAESTASLCDRLLAVDKSRD